jgi:hypothetical protein
VLVELATFAASQSCDGFTDRVAELLHNSQLSVQSSEAALEDIGTHAESSALTSALTRNIIEV